MVGREPTEGEVREAVGFIGKSVPFRVKLGIILGSGLGEVRDAFQPVRTFPYGQIPHFPVSTVPSHMGRLIVGRKGKLRAYIMDGRVHRYEGYSFGQVAFPVVVLRELGVTMMIVTNAAGAVSRRFAPGDIMLIADHIDLMWKGVAQVSGRPQVWHRPYYSKRLTEWADELGRRMGIRAKRGVLLATPGPSYETRSEVEFARKIGADAATMSTIPEVTVCHRLGIAVLGMSLITNMAPVDDRNGHEEVVALARRGSKSLQRLILAVAENVQGAA